MQIWAFSMVDDLFSACWRVCERKKQDADFVLKSASKGVSSPTLYYHYRNVKPKIGRLYQNVGHFVVKRWSGVRVVSTIILTRKLRKPLCHRASGVVCQSVGGNPQNAIPTLVCSFADTICSAPANRSNNCSYSFTRSMRSRRQKRLLVFPPCSTVSFTYRWGEPTLHSAHPAYWPLSPV